MGHGPRLGTPILTRAGDQDDVSSEQTPSNYPIVLLPHYPIVAYYRIVAYYPIVA